MQISFGAKIPISTCNIYDKKDDKFIRATLYEIDCKDKSDLKYLDKIKGIWKYKTQITDDAKRKYERTAKNNSKLFWRKRPAHDQLLIQDNQFFSIETPKKDVVCLCETAQYGKDIDVNFLESSKNDSYKYAGQAMLASLAKHIVGTNKILTVKIPTHEATPFYRDVCRFKRADYFGFELPDEDAVSFIRNVESKTKGKILDCDI